MKIDAYDWKLLSALDSNAREGYVKLAKKVGLSRDAVKYRIHNYLKKGLLDGFYTLINSSKLGYYSFRIYLSFTNSSLEDEDSLIDYLMSQKEVFYITRVEGSFDIGFGYFARSIIEFNDFLTNLKAYFSSIDIHQQGLFVYLQHFDRTYLTNEKRLQEPKKIIQEPNKTSLDEKDQRILEILANNARIQIIDISREVNLTSKAVIYRINSLEKRGIILGYKPKINLEKINYSMYKVDIFLRDRSTIDNIKRLVFQLPNIIHSQEVFGGSDLEFDIECKDYTEFIRIIKIIKKKFGKNISRITHYRTTKVYKTVYLPKSI